MCKMFDEWSDEIKKFCDDNGFSFEKALHLAQSWGTVRGCGRDVVVLQYFDPEKGKMGLRDETPMPVVLEIEKQENGLLQFVQTEHTQKYLA
ncbi:MAG: hypothetical protein HDT47_00450 [Ruminococcaceae bacterium]|nr:hypothetical protein [Oscillospiraceae bacterium]